MTSWRHDDLALDLAHHLAIPSRLVWTDMQIGPMHSHRPDVFTLEKSYSLPLPTVYECKISVSDFRSDITSGKWQKYLEFASSVTFAVPKGLVNKADIPAGCGFMTRGDDGWTTIKKPTKQVAKLSVDHMMKLFIDGYGRELGQIEMQRKLNWEHRAEEKIRHKFGDEVGKIVRDLNSARVMIRYYEERQEKARERGEKDAERIRALQEEEWTDLRKALGLSDKAGMWEIQREIHKIREAQRGGDESEAVSALRRVLNTVSSAIEQYERMRLEPKPEQAA